MIVALEVTTGVYKLSQDQQTKDLRYYRFNQLVKTEPADKLYQPEELFDLLCKFAFNYNVKEDEYIG